MAPAGHAVYQRSVRKVGRVLRSLGVLVGAWAILAVIGLIAGVVPMSVFGGDGGTTSSHGTTAHGSHGKPTPDAGLTHGTKAPASTAQTPRAARDAGRPAPAVAPATVPRWTVCDPAVTEPSLSAVQIVGDPRPEIAVGCGSLVHLVSVISMKATTGGTTGALVPWGIATFETTEEQPDTTLRAAPVVAGDVDDDGEPDLVLGFLSTAGSGGARGGTLWLVPQAPSGAFAAPERLAPIGVGAMALGAFDAHPGLDIAALDRTNAYARRPSEVWVFSGGPSPARGAVLRAGVGGVALAVADLDHDAHLDVLVASGDGGRVDVFFGDGAGRFPRSAMVEVPKVTELVAGDLDGDGITDVLAKGQGLHLLPGGSADAIAPRTIAAPPSLFDVAVTDLDGDGRRDILGTDGAHVLWLRQKADGTFEPKTLISPEGFVLARVVVTDLDADGRPDAVLLGRHGTSTSAPWELVFVPDVRDRDAKTPLATAPSPLRDAPLRLTIALR